MEEPEGVNSDEELATDMRSYSIDLSRKEKDAEGHLTIKKKLEQANRLMKTERTNLEHS